MIGFCLVTHVQCPYAVLCPDKSERLSMNLEAIAVFYFDFRFSVILNAVKNPVETLQCYYKELDSSSASLLRMTEKNKSHRVLSSRWNAL